MAAYTLTTSPQRVGSIYLAEGSTADRYFQVRAYYAKKDATTAYVYVQLYFSSNSNVSGSGRVSINDGTSQSFSFSRNSTSALAAIEVPYNAATGQSKNNALKVQLSNMSAQWGDGTSFDASPQNIVNTTYDLPDIDPLPTTTISSVVIQSNGYEGQVVASVTTLRVTMSFAYAKQATLTVNGAGITTNYTLSVTKASSETLTQDFIVPGYSIDYTLSLTLTASNDTGTVQITTTKAVKGYYLPIYGPGTYTTRCDSSGVADINGEYGRLYLTWDVAEIYSTIPNTLQTCVVELNGTAITVTDGSIAQGFLDFIFPLAVNVQGNLEVTLTDEILSNVITSLVVPKQTMPLSLYQSGDSVGVAIGRMATSAGLWIYEQMYYKDPSGTSVYPVEIEDGYLVVSGASTPLPYLEVREITATISKAVGSSVSISAPTVTGYTFVGWLNLSTYGWIGSVYMGNNNASSTVYVSGNSGNTTGTGTVRAYALYQRTIS